MNPELDFLVFVTIIALVAIFWIAGKQQEKMREEEPKTKQKKGLNTTPKSDEVIDLLNWMLANGIITTQEYNKIIAKCLPFIG